MSSYCRLVVLRFLAAGFFAMYLLTVVALIGGGSRPSALSGIIGAARLYGQVRTRPLTLNQGHECNAGSDRTRGEHRAPPEGPRRDRRGGGILDRRPDFGGATGAARRVRLLPRRCRRLHPGGPASAAGPAEYLGAGHARLDRALCAAAGANRAPTLRGELGAGRERSHRAERQSLRRC